MRKSSLKPSEYLSRFEWIKSLELKPSLPIKEGCDCPDYPIILDSKSKAIFFYEQKNKCRAEVRIALQDNYAVGSFDFMVGCGSEGDGGEGFAPGRKWGEFSSLDAADLYYSRYLLERLIHKSNYSPRHKRLTEPCIKKLIEHIQSIKLQLELFA
jgi:hypothetical protein